MPALLNTEIKCPSTSMPITCRRSSSPRSNATAQTSASASHPPTAARRRSASTTASRCGRSSRAWSSPWRNATNGWTSRGIDHQIVGTWPDIFGYGLPREHCIAWHRMLNDTLAEWTADNAQKFSWISSVPLDRRRGRRGRARTLRAHRRHRRHHLRQHRGREPRRDPARSVLAQGRGARPSHPHPSGERRRCPAHARNSRSPRSRSTPTTPRSASARC